MSNKEEKQHFTYNDDEIKSLIKGLQGIMLNQQTPKRVSHRRADKIRKRRVIEVKDIQTFSDFTPVEVEFSLRCQSGTYVKETVHGDDGRTQPSVAELFNADCEVLSLDVVDIHAD